MNIVGVAKMVAKCLYCALIAADLRAVLMSIERIDCRFQFVIHIERKSIL